MGRITAAEKWWIYIVECADGTLYTGIALDVDARIVQHNDGTGAKYTRGRRPVRLVYTETARGQSAALRRELALKGQSAVEKRLLLKAKRAERGRKGT